MGKGFTRAHHTRKNHTFYCLKSRAFAGMTQTEKPLMGTLRFTHFPQTELQGLVAKGRDWKRDRLYALSVETSGHNNSRILRTVVCGSASNAQMVQHGWSLSGRYSLHVVAARPIAQPGTFGGSTRILCHPCPPANGQNHRHAHPGHGAKSLARRATRPPAGGVGTIRSLPGGVGPGERLAGDLRPATRALPPIGDRTTTEPAHTTRGRQVMVIRG
jgi:hypothetical protein